MNEEEFEQYQQEIADLRMGWFAQFGSPDARVIAERLSTQPPWPGTGKRYQRLHSEYDTTIFITDGLSDPTPENPNRAGFNAECYIEIPGTWEWEEEAGNPLWEWAGSLVIQAGNDIAAQGYDFHTTYLSSHQLLSVSVGAEGMGLPKDYFFESEGNSWVGLLMGLGHPRNLSGGWFNDSADSYIHFIPIKPLTAAETMLCINGGATARFELAAKFIEDGTYHIADLNRASYGETDEHV